MTPDGRFGSYYLYDTVCNIPRQATDLLFYMRTHVLVFICRYVTGDSESLHDGTNGAIAMIARQCGGVELELVVEVSETDA